MTQDNCAESIRATTKIVVIVCLDNGIIEVKLINGMESIFVSLSNDTDRVFGSTWAMLSLENDF